MSGVEMAESIVAAIPRMLRIIAATPPPFIARGSPVRGRWMFLLEAQRKVASDRTSAAEAR
jgi:hypothetical protein